MQRAPKPRAPESLSFAMRHEYIIIRRLACFLLLLYFACLRATGEETGLEYSRGCDHLRCESGGRCIKRRFWCKNPPCPGMLYCSKSRKESLKGPITCDTVRCSEGFACVVRVRGCHWDAECRQQIARCVSEREYYEGAASCAGYACPSGKRCILLESRCAAPPCKLVRSCADAKDAQTWFGRCRSLDCLSEYECFLRKPDNDCPDCAYIPDCMFTEDELISAHCRGWICPRGQRCTVRIVGTCKGYNCTVARSCRESSIASVKHDAVTRKPTASTATSMWQQSTPYATPEKRDTEVSMIQRRVTISSSSITQPSGSSSSNKPYPTLPHPPPGLNRNKLSTTDTIDDNGPTTVDEGNVFAITSRNFSDWSNVPSFPATSFAERKLAPVTSTGWRDATAAELLKRIYVAADDALPLPVVLGGINFVGQGYPVWIRNDLHRSTAGARNESDSGWRYYAPREPYRILLPPYEPVVLVEDARRGQLPPFLTYAFDHPLNEAVLIPLPEITSADTTEKTKTDDIPAIVIDGIDNDANGSTTVEIENYKANRSDDSYDDYENFPAMEEVNQAPISNISNTRDARELDNRYDIYERRPLMIHDYLGKSGRRLIHEQGLKSSAAVAAAADDLHGRTSSSSDAGSSVRGRIAAENKARAFEGPEDLATLVLSSAARQSDRGSRNEERHVGLVVNYPYDTVTTVHDDVVDEPGRESHRGSPPNKIPDVPTSHEKGNQVSSQRDAPPYHDEESKRKSETREYDEHYGEYDDDDDDDDDETTRWNTTPTF